MQPIDAPLDSRRERKRRETADRLARVAFELFEQEGLEVVTMEQIARAADVARGTLYNHFPVKEALLDHYFQLELRDGIGAVLEHVYRARTLEAQLWRLFDKFAEWAVRRRPYLPASLAYGTKRQLQRAADDSPDDLGGVFLELLQRAKARGEVAPRADCRRLADYLQYLYLAATLRWLSSRAGSPKAELRRMVDTFLHGAASRGRSSGDDR